jgi:hypothetical protein
VVDSKTPASYYRAVYIPAYGRLVHFVPRREGTLVYSRWLSDLQIPVWRLTTSLADSARLVVVLIKHIDRDFSTVTQYGIWDLLLKLGVHTVWIFYVIEKY